MTVVAGNKKRVAIRDAKPGDRFDVRATGNGKFVLTKLEPVSETPLARVRIVKRGKYSVGVIGRPISEEAIKAVLDGFPLPCPQPRSGAESL